MYIFYPNQYDLISDYPMLQPKEVKNKSIFKPQAFVNCTYAGGGQWDGISVYRRNLLYISLIRGLICDLVCKNNPAKAECSNKMMFVDSHTQSSKNERFLVKMPGFTHYMTAGEFVGARSNCVGDIF